MDVVLALLLGEKSLKRSKGRGSGEGRVPDDGKRLGLSESALDVVYRKVYL